MLDVPGRGHLAHQIVLARTESCLHFIQAPDGNALIGDNREE